MKTHLSYLMGAENIRDEDLTNLQIEIARNADSEARMLKIPDTSLTQYIELIREKLTRGFWNEIVGPEHIIFLFKFRDGHVEEYTLSSENESQVDRLCAEFNNEQPENTTNVYKYVADNDFYHDFMMEHYADMINR